MKHRQRRSKKDVKQNNHKLVPLEAQTPNQKEYIKSVKDNQVVICSGPAGTGKTHIATSMAIMGLVREEYEKVISCSISWKIIICYFRKKSFHKTSILS